MKYFTIDELCRSVSARRLGIDNTPNKVIVENLTMLVEKVLDPLREEFGRPIIVNSGYRCPRLNEAVGGAKNSQHKLGQAVDIQSVGDRYNRELFELLKKYDFDQLIDEYNLDWIHVSYASPEKNRHQILKAIKKDGKTVYLPKN